MLLKDVISYQKGLYPCIKSIITNSMLPSDAILCRYSTNWWWVIVWSSLLPLIWSSTNNQPLLPQTYRVEQFLSAGALVAILWLSTCDDNSWAFLICGCDDSSPVLYFLVAMTMNRSATNSLDAGYQRQTPRWAAVITSCWHRLSM